MTTVTPMMKKAMPTIRNGIITSFRAMRASLVGWL